MFSKLIDSFKCSGNENLLFLVSFLNWLFHWISTVFLKGKIKCHQTTNMKRNKYSIGKTEIKRNKNNAIAWSACLHHVDLPSTTFGSFFCFWPKNIRRKITIQLRTMCLTFIFHWIQRDIVSLTNTRAGQMHTRTQRQASENVIYSFYFFVRRILCSNRFGNRNI